MDLAEIGLLADSSQIRKADKDLDDFSASAKGAEKSADEFNKSTASADKTAGRFSNTLARMKQPIGFLTSALATLGVGLGLNFVMDAADNFTQFGNQLRVAGLEGEQFATVQDRLFDAANRNGASINALGTLYARANLASETLGASQEQLLQFTDGVTDRLRVAGTSAGAASGALLQLSQALGGGIVRAEEFNSILEGAPTIVQAVADGLERAGGSVSTLRNLVLEGSVSSKEFFEAFLLGSQSLIGQAEGMNLTIGAAFTTLSNGMIRFIGELSTVTGASTAVAMAIQGIGIGLSTLAGWLPTIIEYLTPLAPLLIATFGPIMLGYVVSLAGAIGVTLFGAFVSLFTLLAANPLTAFVGAMVLILSYMVDWEKSIHALINAWAIFVAEWQLFWGNEEGAKRTIEIAINAKEAVSDMLAAGEEIRATVEKGFQFGTQNAAPQLTSALDVGGREAAGHIQKSMRITSEQAQKTWEGLNGKVIQPLGDTLVEGGDYIANEATGAVEKAGQTITDGADQVGQTIERKIVSAGEQAGSTIFNSMESAFATLAPLMDVFAAFLRRERIELNQILVETALAAAETRKALAEAAAIRNGRGDRGGSTYDGGSSGGGGNIGIGIHNRVPTDSSRVGIGAGSFATGGSFVVGGAGGVDSQLVQMYATPGERVTVDHQNKSKEPVSVDLKSVNILDPEMMIVAMQSAAGQRVFVNMVRANREEVIAILGGY